MPRGTITVYRVETLDGRGAYTAGFFRSAMHRLTPYTDTGLYNQWRALGDETSNFIFGFDCLAQLETWFDCPKERAENTTDGGSKTCDCLYIVEYKVPRLDVRTSSLQIIFRKANAKRTGKLRCFATLKPLDKTARPV